MMAAMRWRFDPVSLVWAVALFVLLVLLATVGARWGWVRSFFGDVLAVAWVYAVFKTVIAARVLTLASAALCVGLRWWSWASSWHRPSSCTFPTERCASCWAARPTGGMCWPM